MRSVWNISPSILLWGSGLALGAGLTGCAIENTRQNADSFPMTAMPTVGPPPKPPAPPPPESEIVTAAARSALSNDLPATLQTLQLAGDPAARAHAGTALVAALAAQNPAVAATVALALPSGPAQTAAVEIAAHAFVQHDAAAALRWAFELYDAVTANLARRAVARELVRENPRNAMDRIKALPAGPARADVFVFAAAAWAAQDGASAVAWLRELPDDAFRQRLTSTIAFEIAQTKPDRAIALAEDLPAGRSRWLIFSAIAQTWIIKDPKAALAWSAQLPAGEARDAAHAGIETGLGVPSSRRAAPFPGIRNSNPRSAASGTAFATGSAETNNPAFDAWLATQPRSMTRDEAILEFIRQRGALDVGSIGNWVASLPGGTTRQRAIEIYFDETVRGSPANAANWLRSLPSSDRSDEMIEKTARQWLQTDPRAAEAWLRETTLPPFRQEELLRNAPR